MKAIRNTQRWWREVHHPINDTMTWRFQCMVCGRKTLTKNVMEYHLYRYHNITLSKEVRND